MYLSVTTTLLEYFNNHNRIYNFIFKTNYKLFLSLRTPMKVLCILLVWIMHNDLYCLNSFYLKWYSIVMK